MGDKEIKSLVLKILDKVDFIESSVKIHSNEFVQLHTQISTYHTELLTFSSDIRELESEYKNETKNLINLKSTIDTHEKSLAEILDIKDQISSCPYCLRYSKESNLFNNAETDYERYIG